MRVSLFALVLILAALPASAEQLVEVSGTDAVCNAKDSGPKFALSLLMSQRGEERLGIQATVMVCSGKAPRYVVANEDLTLSYRMPDGARKSIKVERRLSDLELVIVGEDDKIVSVVQGVASGPYIDFEFDREQLRLGDLIYVRSNVETRIAGNRTMKTDQAISAIFRYAPSSARDPLNRATAVIGIRGLVPLQ